MRWAAEDSNRQVSAQIGGIHCFYVNDTFSPLNNSRRRRAGRRIVEEQRIRNTESHACSALMRGTRHSHSHAQCWREHESASNVEKAAYWKKVGGCSGDCLLASTVRKRVIEGLVAGS